MEPLADRVPTLRTAEAAPMAPRRRASSSRKTRSALEWRSDLMGIYSTLFHKRSNGIEKTLRAHCQENENIVFPAQYKRIAAIWNELKLEQDLSSGVNPSNESFVSKINGRFPEKAATQNSSVANADSDDEEATSNVTTSRVRTNKNTTRTAQQWKDLLLDLFFFLSSAKTGNRKESVRSYCVKILHSEQSYRRVHEIWKALGLDKDLESDVSPSDGLIKAKLQERFGADEQSDKENNNNGRDLRPSSNSYFDRYEEDLLRECVAGFARAGFPLEKSNLKTVADNFLKADGIDTSGNGGISNDTNERIYKEGSMKAVSNVNPIDPQRAAQAEPHVLNAMYHQLDNWIAIAHEVNPTAWPEDRYANIPPSRIYNTDEQGPNPTALRNPVLIPKDMLDQRSRLFQNTREGDGKMQFHYSVANIVRADGVQCHPHESVEGAPAPYVLISDPSSVCELDNMDKASRDRLLANQTEDNTTFTLNPSVLEGWHDQYQLGKKDTLVNKFGFQIRTTPTGSMLKRTFYDFILHFVQQLPHDQGANGLGVVLFLDWHCSRECPQSLLTTFFEHNVLLFVLPSKTSIWAQPCDNGKNELTAKHIAITAHNMGLMIGTPLDYIDANKIFRGGLEMNCLEQNDELRRTGTNAVVSSFKKTGLYPIDYDNEGWQSAFQNFSKLNQLVRQQKQEAGEILPQIVWVSKAKTLDSREPLSAEDEEAIRSFLTADDFLVRGGANSDEDSENQHPLSMERMPLIILAMAIGDQMIGEYAHDVDRDVAAPPVANTFVESVALKLIEFVAVTHDNRVDTTCTLSSEAIARDKLRTKLSLLQFGHAITLRKKAETEVPLNLMKQTPQRFIVLDNERRSSRNMIPMSVNEILDTCFDAKDDQRYSLTVKDRVKCRRKARVARKKLNESMYGEAKEEANNRRLKRNVDVFTSNLALKRPRFANQLKAILEEEEGFDMTELYLEMEKVVLEPYSDSIAVTRGDTSKQIDVTVVGTDVSAVSHKMETTLMKTIVELKKTGDKSKRRKRRRKAGQSTHLGKSGVAVGILIQRQHKEEELKMTEKQEKSILDELDRLKSLLSKTNELVVSMPGNYWKYDKVKGKRREVLARLFGVYTSKAKADDLSSALKALHLSENSFQAKLNELKVSVASKERSVAPIIAKRREQEDFIASTADYADAPAEPTTATMGALDDEDDDSDIDG
ncbi:unknown protein [Seminavis robusta]|uniref:DDE-1 domain-containing protein n=1 Tax=Seminavis robusta TaxID=568900 RepID=A0A9N8HXY7_9STRA|nr:unknown protein [Seminavis robusta]|eukprot:Sro2665_g334120.1 n/a (1196) ;mRNA; f:5282-8869